MSIQYTTGMRGRIKKSRRACPVFFFVRTALFVMLCVQIAVPTAAQHLEPTRIYDLNALSGNPFPNALRPVDLAVDGTRHLAYAVADASANIVVTDVQSGRIVRVFPIPAEISVGSGCRIDVNPTSWMLLLRDPSMPGRLHGLSVMSGALVAVFDTPGSNTIASVAVDAARNRVFVSDGTPVLRVLDGTSLRQMDTILTAVSMNAGGIVFDSLRSEILALARDVERGRVQLQAWYSQKPHQLFWGRMTRTEQAADRIVFYPADQRLAMVGSTRVNIFGPSGLLECTAEFPGGIADAELCVATNTLYIADASGWLNGPIGERAGKIHRLHFSTFARDSFSIGRHVRRLAVDQPLARLVVASEDDNRLLVLDCRSNRLLSETDPGESAEGLAYSAELNELYIADRFGEGDGLLRLRLGLSSVDMLRVGTAPLFPAFDPDRRRLIVYAHHESAVMDLDPSAPLSLRKLRLPGQREGRSDDLPHMSVDRESGLALVCVPEMESWSLVDTRAGTALLSGRVDGFTFVPTGQAGRLQGALLPRSGLFFVLRADARLLNVYDLRDGRFLREVNLAGVDWPSPVGSDADLLFADPDRGRLFVAGQVFENTDFEFPPRALAGMTQCIGITRDGRRSVALELTDKEVRLRIHDLATGFTRHSFSLFEAGRGRPQAILDQDGRRIFVSEPHTALIREYRIDALLHAEDVEAAPASPRIRLFPNPVRAGADVVVDFSGTIDRSFGVPRLAVTDMLGRATQAEILSSADDRFILRTTGLAPGLYTVHVSSRNGLTAAALIVR